MSLGVDWWEVVKQRIKEFCIAFGVAKRRKERERVWSLQGELQFWVGVANRRGRVNTEKVRRLKAEIKAYYTQKAKRFAFLARAESRERDERVTAFFFRAVRSCQSAGYIEELTSGQGEVLQQQQDKLDAAALFYSVLFGREERDVEEGDRLVAQLWREVQEGRQDALGGSFGMEEVREALFSLKVGKTPGRDGITRELYTRFWGIMAEDVVEVFNRVGVVGRTGYYKACRFLEAGGEVVKVLQYADDTTVVVSSDRDMERVMSLVGRYCKGRGSE
ncbi:hypothetical protein SKAU_G00387110 [Synaphobranchus kaupii]|uniref:Uncharacterized protein n=1 Tax=Synaphobranchus kaupii TaxID=118154 RepID=A0A9Q1ID74_SYNKA|nr:hypothetical protein SKAU_G00387110 [Synaphobranchus kaupii]